MTDKLTETDVEDDFSIETTQGVLLLELCPHGGSIRGHTDVISGEVSHSTLVDLVVWLQRHGYGTD